MVNRYYKLVLFNASLLALLGLGMLPYVRHFGNAVIAGLCFLASAILFIFSPNFKDPAPTWDEIRKMMRGFYGRMLS